MHSPVVETDGDGRVSVETVDDGWLDSGQIELQRRRVKAASAQLGDSVLVVVLYCSGRTPGRRIEWRSVMAHGGGTSS
jgi:hypothetical protein